MENELSEDWVRIEKYFTVKGVLHIYKNKKTFDYDFKMEE